jgi:hypothetical protein
MICRAGFRIGRVQHIMVDRRYDDLQYVKKMRVSIERVGEEDKK